MESKKFNVKIFSKAMETIFAGESKFKFDRFTVDTNGILDRDFAYVAEHKIDKASSLVVSPDILKQAFSVYIEKGNMRIHLK